MNQNEIPAAIPKEMIEQIPFKKHSLILFVCDAMDLPVDFSLFLKPRGVSFPI